MSKISTKFQATIPVDARKRFNLQVRERLIFKEESGKLVIEKA